jgi:hypothetical protein
MIKITRGDGISRKILEVTQGAYENIFRAKGYVPFEPEKSGGSNPAEGALKKSDDELFMDAVRAKPISQWSNKELQRYAGLVGLDPKSKDLREAIKEAVERKSAGSNPPGGDDENGRD